MKTILKIGFVVFTFLMTGLFTHAAWSAVHRPLTQEDYLNHREVLGDVHRDIPEEDDPSGLPVFNGPDQPISQEGTGEFIQDEGIPQGALRINRQERMEQCILKRTRDCRNLNINSYQCELIAEQNCQEFVQEQFQAVLERIRNQNEASEPEEPLNSYPIVIDAHALPYEPEVEAPNGENDGEGDPIFVGSPAEPGAPSTPATPNNDNETELATPSSGGCSLGDMTSNPASMNGVFEIFLGLILIARLGLKKK